MSRIQFPNKTRLGLLSIALVGGINLTASAFAVEALPQGYQLAAAEKAGEGKCGEGKCGADSAHAKATQTEGKCGEGKCGASDAKAKATQAHRASARRRSVSCAMPSTYVACWESTAKWNTQMRAHASMPASAQAR